MATMPERFSHSDRSMAAWFLAAALLAGVITFFFGPGLRALLLAPRYRPAAEAALKPGFSTSPARIPSLPEAGDIALTEEYGNWIRIPALSLNLPLAAASSMENTDILRALQIGVVRYPNGVEPGQPGVVAIAGHSTGEPWKGRYRFAFLHARKLRPRDIIEVDHAGTRYTYVVTGQRMVNPKETPFLESAAETSRISIITCWPLWTTKQRLVVDAELASAQRLVVRPLTTATPPL